MDRKEELQTLRAQIRTDSYEMSIWEWMSLYEHDEIVLVPEFRRSRAYPWSNEQKTRFIEFILLGIPISPILVSQRPDGILKDEDGKLLEPLVLTRGQYFSALAGKRWDDREEREDALNSRQQFLIITAKMPVKIIFETTTLPSPPNPLSQFWERGDLYPQTKRDIPKKKYHLLGWYPSISLHPCSLPSSILHFLFIRALSPALSFYF